MQSFCYVVLLQWLLCRRTSDIVHRSDAKPITWKCSFIDAHAPHAPRRVLHAAPCCSVQRGVYVTVCKYCLNLVLHYYIWLAFVEGQIELGTGSCAEWVEFRPDADANADSDSDEARGGEWGGVWCVGNKQFVCEFCLCHAREAHEYENVQLLFASLQPFCHPPSESPYPYPYPYLQHKQTVRKLKAKYDDVRLADFPCGRSRVETRIRIRRH